MVTSQQVGRNIWQQAPKAASVLGMPLPVARRSSRSLHSRAPSRSQVSGKAPAAAFQVPVGSLRVSQGDTGVEQAAEMKENLGQHWAHTAPRPSPLNDPTSKSLQNWGFWSSGEGECCLPHQKPQVLKQTKVLKPSSFK